MNPPHALTILLALCAGGVFSASATESIESWKALDPPKVRCVRWYCENHADFVWRVTLDDGVLETRKLDVMELYENYFTSAAATPQFSIDGFQDFPRRFIEVGDGFLVGYNQGEWGGGIFWFSRDGKNHYEVSRCAQVTDFIRHGADVFALEGLSHLGISNGTFLQFEKENGKWLARTIAKLPGAPGPHILDGPDRILLIAEDDLVSLRFSGEQKTLHKSARFGSANSLVRDPDGVVFIGAGDVVIQLVPEGSFFREKWLVRPEDAESCQCHDGLTSKKVRCDD
jgi:hypothetical protein